MVSSTGNNVTLNEIAYNGTPDGIDSARQACTSAEQQPSATPYRNP